MEPIEFEYEKPEYDAPEPEKSEFENTKLLPNPLFLFMGIGSLIYAFFYTLFLYKNNSGITYPFFVGGTCFFFFLYLKKSGITAKPFSVFITISLVLLGFSTCMTDSWILIFLNKLGIFCLFFYLVLHNLYEDKQWDLPKYMASVLNIVFSSLLYVFTPFIDFANFRENQTVKQEKPKGKGKYVIGGIVLALPFLFIILLLLGSADAVFGNLLDHIFSFEINFEEHIFGISFLYLFAFLASYSIMRRISNHNIKEEIKNKKTAEPIMGITFTGLISLVYMIFCFIQIVYLFAGFGTLPEYYTYASYAREGFFQLVFVCLINLALVLICIKRFRESKLLKGLLVFISLCTYIMIASSAYRMILYIQVYYLTFLRVFVLWALFIIFLLMTGALVMIYKEDIPFVKYCLITVTSLYLLFSFAHPDYWIARYNFNQMDFNDPYYIIELSMDAAPVIFDNADQYILGDGTLDYWFMEYASDMIKASYRYDKKKNIKDGLIREKSLRRFNFSRWKAYDVYNKYYTENDDFAEQISRWIKDI